MEEEEKLNGKLKMMMENVMIAEVNMKKKMLMTEKSLVESREQLEASRNNYDKMKKQCEDLHHELDEAVKKCVYL